MIRILVDLTTDMCARVEGHAEVCCPERFVDTREVDTHLIEWFSSVVSWLDPQISHPAQPIVHPLDSPVSIFMEEEIVASDESTKSSFVRRYMWIIHQILHHLLCHVHSSHLSSPTRDQQGVCHDTWTHSFASLHLLEQVYCTIHALQLDPTLYDCVVSTIIRPQSYSSHRSKN